MGNKASNGVGWGEPYNEQILSAEGHESVKSEFDQVFHQQQDPRFWLPSDITPSKLDLLSPTACLGLEEGPLSEHSLLLSEENDERSSEMTLEKLRGGRRGGPARHHTEGCDLTQSMELLFKSGSDNCEGGGRRGLKLEQGDRTKSQRLLEDSAETFKTSKQGSFLKRLMRALSPSSGSSRSPKRKFTTPFEGRSKSAEAIKKEHDQRATRVSRSENDGLKRDSNANILDPRDPSSSRLYSYTDTYTYQSFYSDISLNGPRKNSPPAKEPLKKDPPKAEPKKDPKKEEDPKKQSNNRKSKAAPPPKKEPPPKKDLKKEPSKQELARKPPPSSSESKTTNKSRMTSKKFSSSSTSTHSPSATPTTTNRTTSSRKVAHRPPPKKPPPHGKKSPPPPRKRPSPPPNKRSPGPGRKKPQPPPKKRSATRSPPPPQSKPSPPPRRRPPPNPRKKPPPPPIYISNSYGSGSGSLAPHHKSSKTPADRLENVDIVEELVYNCPVEGGGGCCGGGGNDGSCDYYCCCDDCGECQMVPNPKSTNPVRYCRRQRFNFNDGKNKDECCEGPPFNWQNRHNPYDDIPVGKNPTNPTKICGHDPVTTTTRKKCQGEVLPSESGTYFYDAERRTFVPVLEVDCPDTPEPEVIDEIIDEEPVLTNIEPIIQPMMQPTGMGGGFPPIPLGGALGQPCPIVNNIPCGGAPPKCSKKGTKKDCKEPGAAYPSPDLGLLGLSGLNMAGLANMGPYGSLAIPQFSYQPPPCPPCCPGGPCPPGCPCPPAPGECCCPPSCPCPPCQPFSNCCYPPPGCYPPQPYPYGCPVYNNYGGKRKKSKKDKKKSRRDDGTETQRPEQAHAETGAADDPSSLESRVDFRSRSSSSKESH